MTVLLVAATLCLLAAGFASAVESGDESVVSADPSDSLGLDSTAQADTESGPERRLVERESGERVDAVVIALWTIAGAMTVLLGVFVWHTSPRRRLRLAAASAQAFNDSSDAANSDSESDRGARPSPESVSGDDSHSDAGSQPGRAAGSGGDPGLDGDSESGGDSGLDEESEPGAEPAGEPQLGGDGSAQEQVGSVQERLVGSASPPRRVAVDWAGLMRRVAERLGPTRVPSEDESGPTSRGRSDRQAPSEQDDGERSV